MTAALKAEVDRLSELANIGAGHAAGAFAQLTGKSIKMAVPRVHRVGRPGIARVSSNRLISRDYAAGESEQIDENSDKGPSEFEQATNLDRGWNSGVIFEFEGCLNTVVAILFRWEMCEAVVRNLTGQSEGYLPPETVESALMEVGNVLASHVASAIADTLGARLLPSIPMLALNSAFDQLESLARARKRAGDLWIESELVDSEGTLGGLVVLIPDRETS